jgi:phosphoribosyl 1,2-cyclic phosphodiesterase
MNFETLKSAAIDYFDIESFVLNHPGGAVGYKITVGNKKVCIALDHEFGHNQELDSLFQIAAKNADAVVWDGMFTELELPEKKGWGHSSVEQGIRFAEDTGIKSLFITHHAPLRTDLELDLISKEIHTSGIKLARESENNFI